MARSKRFHVLIVAALALLLALPVAEFIARRSSPTYRRMHSPPQPFVRPHPERGWELVPGWTGDPEWGTQLRVNQLGLRGPETTEAKPAGVFRVLLAGDSVVMGTGLDEGGLIDRRLEYYLQRISHNKNIEVLNGGVSGYDIRQIRSFIIDRGLKLSPNVIVVVTCWNDLPGLSIGDVINPVRDLPVPGKDWLVRHSAIALMLRSAYESIGLDSFAPAWLDGSLHEPTRARIEAGWRAYIDEFEKIFRACREHHVTLIVMAVPHEAQFFDQRRRFIPQARLREWALHHGLGYADVAPEFDQEIDLPYIQPDPIHPSPRGHDIMGKKLAWMISYLLDEQVKP